MKMQTIQSQPKDGLTRTKRCQELKVTAAAQQELLRLERTLLEQTSLASGAEFPAEILERSQPETQWQRSKTPRVGIFFLVDNEPLIASLPWTEIPCYAGYRTFGVGHIDFWGDLRERDRVPEAVYDLFPRGRVSRHDATRTFTLFADRCIVRNKRLTGTILKLFNLPSSTRILADQHYTCQKCERRTEASESALLDWNWENLAFYPSRIGAR